MTEVTFYATSGR